MRTGVLLPRSLETTSSRDLVAWARTAEDLGFDSLGVRGRIVHDSLEPLVALSLVAASTRRIELVLFLTAPRLERPGILHRQIARLERASRGRLTVAVGVGGAEDDTWFFTGPNGSPRSLAFAEAPETDDAGDFAVRDALQKFERAGTDDVLIDPHSPDLRRLEQLAALRTPALV